MKEIFAQILILTLVIALTSCSIVTDVFKTGISFGIIIMVALFLGLVYLKVCICKK